MSAPFTRSSLLRGPALFNFNSHTFFTRDDISIEHGPNWSEVLASMYSTVDEAETDRIYTLKLRLWGAFENLSDLFPPAVLNPVSGASLFGATDSPAKIWARNGDWFQYTNMAVTGLANLFLGVDEEIFAADVELTGLCANAANPEDAGAYYTFGNAALTESAFAKTNYTRQRWTGTWGAITGFTPSFVAQKGWNVSWDMKKRPITVSGYGTRDMALESFRGICEAIPIGPSIAQIEAGASTQGKPLGGLLSSSAADLVLTGNTTGYVALKGAGIVKYGYAYGIDPLRLAKVTWRTTRGFTAGVPQAVALVTTIAP